jgi:5-methyltetrahydropteroyltriglutamate--homocysteine methyltransferase
MTSSTVYGYPRQGANRELKKAVEAYWAGRIDDGALRAAARELRLARLVELRASGLGEIPSNDFSLYDHVLDTAWLVGAVPARHAGISGALDRYFAMARGTAEVAPLEMTKWFDTNYHYLVPELGPDTTFTLDPAKPLAEFA